MPDFHSLVSFHTLPLTQHQANLPKRGRDSLRLGKHFVEMLAYLGRMATSSNGGRAQSYEPLSSLSPGAWTQEISHTHPGFTLRHPHPEARTYYPRNPVLQDGIPKHHSCKQLRPAPARRWAASVCSSSQSKRAGQHSRT